MMEKCRFRFRAFFLLLATCELLIGGRDIMLAKEKVNSNGHHWKESGNGMDLLLVRCPVMEEA
jgi:hypothetical protein